MRWRRRTGTPSPNPADGAVLHLPRPGDAARLTEWFETSPRSAIARVEILWPGDRAVSATDVERRWNDIRERCVHAGLDHTAIDRLGRVVASADPALARSMCQAVHVGLSASPFLVVTTGDHRRRLPDRFLTELSALAEVTITRVGSIEGLGRLELRRPAPRPLSDSDRDLLDVLLGPADAIAPAWERWSRATSIDDHPDFLSVSGLALERLADVDEARDELGRLAGMRRRNWYVGSLLRSETADAIGRLREVGVEPSLAGPLVDAIEADDEGRVRSARSTAILVTPHELDATVHALQPMLDDEKAARTIPPSAIGRGSSVDLAIASGRTLRLQWRWLPDRCAMLVPAPPDEGDVVRIDEVEVAVAPPTARLLELWLDSTGRDRHRPLTTVVRTAELLERHGARIDWSWIEWACTQLELVPHALAHIAALPASMREQIPFDR